MGIYSPGFCLEVHHSSEGLSSCQEALSATNCVSNTRRPIAPLELLSVPLLAHSGLGVVREPNYYQPQGYRTVLILVVFYYFVDY